MQFNKHQEYREETEKIKIKSYWELVWTAFKNHKLAIICLVVLLIFYSLALFPEFYATNDPHETFSAKKLYYAPPRKIRFIDDNGKFHLRPFIYGYTVKLNMQTFEREFVSDTSKKYPIQFFVGGSKYRLWNLIPLDIHLFGVADNEIPVILFGTNKIGQDIYSRTIYASRISLSIGLIGVILNIIFGIIMGGLSGYFGGLIDNVIQRFIEILMGIPKIPLWMTLAAAIPSNWHPLKVYFLITVILSIVGWTGIARDIRGKLLSIRKEEFILSARSFGASVPWIIMRHMIPNFLSYIIVRLTLSVPGMIISETSLSFLGIGLRPPIVSWGVLLKEAQSFQNVVLAPWLLIPGIFVVIAVLSFNFVGDGLRDAADPYQTN